MPSIGPAAVTIAMPSRRVVTARATTGVLMWPAIAMLVALAIAQQMWLGLDCDVSWLLTVGERVLDGARLGRDVVEVNPPASVLLYLPAIELARATGWRVEAVVVAGVVALAAVTVTAAAWLLRSGGLMARTPARVMAMAAAFVLLVLPGGCFAQREHVAVLLALPMLAVIARRVAAVPATRCVASLAGVAGGLVVAIKPHFALALLLPLALAIVRRRSARAALGPEWLAVAAVALAYGAIVLAAFPDYPAMLPLLRAVYLPLRADWLTLLRGPVVALPVALGALAWWVRGMRIAPMPAVLGAAMAGFAIAGVVQGKGYLNHAYPAAALGLLMLAAILSETGPFRRDARVAAAAALLLALLDWHAYAGITARPGLAEAVARVAPARPTVIALSTELAVGHPLTRMIDGRWIGRSAALWGYGGAWARLAEPGLRASERAQLGQIAAADVAGFVADVRAGRPDVVLVDGTVGVGSPRVAGVMRNYRLAARAEDVAVWVRR